MERRRETNILKLFEEKLLVKTCAPMVRYSKLQFRNLVKQYDCDLCFTPMILADSFCKSQKARNNEFTSNSLDTPLIIQFAANTVKDFAGATYMVSPYCDGVDLNCGCPQRWAKEQNLGCELLKNPQTIYELVKECRNRISKPFSISVKTRIQNDNKKNIELVRNLEKCGVSFLTIHARTPENNTGPIDEEVLKLIVENVSVPVIGNGGITNISQCHKLQEKTKVKGVMVANGILSNPTLFSGTAITPLECAQKWVDICYNSTLKPEDYKKIINKTDCCNNTIPERPYNLYFQCFHHHLVFMFEKILTKRQRQIFNNLKSFRDSLEFLDKTLDIRPSLFGIEEYKKSVLLDLDYSDRDSLFKELSSIDDNLKNLEINNDFNLEYDSEKTDGKFFNSKVSGSSKDDCDWTNIFLES